MIEGKISVSSTRSAERKMWMWKNYVIQQESFPFLYSCPLYLSEVLRRFISCNTIYNSTVLYTYIHILYYTNVHGVLFCIFFRVTKFFSFSFPFLHFLSHFPLFTDLLFHVFPRNSSAQVTNCLFFHFFLYRVCSNSVQSNFSGLLPEPR